MLRFFFIFILTLSFIAEAHEVTRYRFSEKNQIQETILEIKVQHEGKQVFHLKLPNRWFDEKKWLNEGSLELSWENCQTEEMRQGAGELTQCIRRAFLAIRGEADIHASGSLKLQALANGSLAVFYETPLYPERNYGFVAKSRPFLKTAKNLPRSSPFSITPPIQRTPFVEHPPVSQGQYESRAVGFLFFGDSGTGSNDQYEVGKGMKKFCSAEPCEFAALLGDNIYEWGVSSSGDSQWQNKFEKPYGDLNFPFYPSLGNHDHYGNIQAQIDYTKNSKKWNMPGRYYHYIKGNLDFFVIDTDDFDPNQRKWLNEKLAASQGRWKFVYGHHPVYSYGWHGDTSHLKTDLLPMLKKYKVDFFLCGHDHDKQVLFEEPVHYLLSGASAKLRSVNSGSKTLFSSSTLGFSHMYCNDEQCTFKMLDKGANVQYQKTVKKAFEIVAGESR